MNKQLYDRLNGVLGKFQKNRGVEGKYSFVNRGNNYKNLLYILAGYKPELWGNVFERIRKENLEEFDICIISSGVCSPKLKSIAEQNGWSYIYSKRNFISNIQNYTISQFPNAEVIWKLDEDMFICADYFKILQETKRKAEAELDYEIGFVGPLIPINSYGYIRFLKHCNKLQEYEKRFGVAKVGFEEPKAINLHTAFANQFLWEVTGNLDEKAKEFNRGKLNYSVCFGRFSIGAIMFERRLWADMGGFGRDCYPCDGRDEIDILLYCALHSKAIVVAEDALVGHYCFGGIYGDMNKFMENSEVEFF